MRKNKYRAQILLEPEQHEALSQIAEQEQRSISDVVREIVQEYLVRVDDAAIWQHRMQALEYLSQVREQAEKKYGVYQGNLVEETHAEQDEEDRRVWKGEA